MGPQKPWALGFLSQIPQGKRTHKMQQIHTHTHRQSDANNTLNKEHTTAAGRAQLKAKHI